MSDPAERHLDQLESALERARQDGDTDEEKAILEEIREFERELADQSRWEDEGHDRGWF